MNSNLVSWPLTMVFFAAETESLASLYGVRASLGAEGAFTRRRRHRRRRRACASYYPHSILCEGGSIDGMRGRGFSVQLARPSPTAFIVPESDGS